MLQMQARQAGGKKGGGRGGGQRGGGAGISRMPSTNDAADLPLTAPLHKKEEVEADVNAGSGSTTPREWEIDADEVAGSSFRSGGDAASGPRGSVDSQLKADLRVDVANPAVPPRTTGFDIADIASSQLKSKAAGDPTAVGAGKQAHVSQVSVSGNQVAPLDEGVSATKYRVEGHGSEEVGEDGDALTGKSAQKKPQLSSFQRFTRAVAKKHAALYGYPGQVSPYMIDPRWPIMRRWDIVTLFLLVFTALVTPFDVAFLDLDALDPLAIVNRIVDACFVIECAHKPFSGNLCINFNLMQYDEDKNVHITSRKEVSIAYLKGFFIIDIVSIFPFDEVGEVFSQSKTDELGQPIKSGGAASHLRVLRVLRIFRLAKLLRILRSGRIFQRFESSLSIKYGVVQLVKFMIATALIAHWMACAWHLVQLIEESRCNWVHAYFTDCALEDDHHTAGARYIASLYLSVMTISTVGYGDVQPQTDAERAYLVCAMLLGASVFAYVVGSICGIVASMDQKDTEFYDLMDSLNTFIKDARLTKDLSYRLRSYFRFRRHCANVKEWHYLLDMMSPSLRGEVAMQLNADWIRQVKFFSNCTRDMLIELTSVLTSETFPPFEEVITAGMPASKMYIIKKGLLICRGRVYGAGKVAGEDMLFKGSVREYSARVLIFSELYAIKREDLGPILQNHPDVARQLRRVVVKYVFREHILAYTRAVRLVEGQVAQQRRDLLLEKNGVKPRSAAPVLLRHNTFLSTLSQAGSGAVGSASLELSYAHQLSVLMRVDEEEARKLEEAAIMMQRHFRGHRDRRQLKKNKGQPKNYTVNDAVECGTATLKLVRALDDVVKCEVLGAIKELQGDGGGGSGGGGSGGRGSGGGGSGGGGSVGGGGGGGGGSGGGGSGAVEAKLDRILDVLGALSERVERLEGWQLQRAVSFAPPPLEQVLSDV